MSVLLAGCGWFATPPEPPPTPTPPPPPLLARVVPRYRLVVDRDALDAPSRLVVLHVRLQAQEEPPVYLDPLEARLLLPEGGAGRVFDRHRSAILLERTWLATWRLDPDPDLPAGGLTRRQAKRLEARIIRHLLDTTAVDSQRSTAGYVVADMRRPRSSLAGAALEVLAHRHGADPVRQQFPITE